MKRTINIRSSNLLIESSIKVGDADYEKKLRKRVVDLQRARNMAAAAKQRAEANGQSDIAQKLEDKIVELDDLLATYNADIIDDEESARDSSSASSKDGNASGNGEEAEDDTKADSEGGEADDGKQGSKDSDNSDEAAEDTDGDGKGKQGKGTTGNPGDKSDGDDDSD
jgi:pericentriolar material 1 protein